MRSPLPDTLPTSVAWLGYGGLLPFIGLPLLAALDPHHQPLWRDALVAYGAVILSFVGALHWGFAMQLPELDAAQRRNRFIWSTVPALLAWPAVLLEIQLAAPLLVAGFIAHYLQDRRLARASTLPGWYLPLRLRLTTVACLSLILAGLIDSASPAPQPLHAGGSHLIHASPAFRQSSTSAPRCAASSLGLQTV